MPRNKQYARLQKDHVFSEKKVRAHEKACLILGQEDLKSFMPVLCKLFYNLNATPRKLSGFSKTGKLIPEFP